MKRIYLFAVALTTLYIGGCASTDVVDSTVEETEGRVHITWQSPNEYRDVRPSNQNRSSFLRQIFSELDKEFEELAEDMPEGYEMKVTVTDLDLAGEVLIGGNGLVAPGISFRLANPINEIRVVQDIFIPRMNFDFSISNSRGEEIMAESVVLKDMAFLQNQIIGRFPSPFVYERRMVNRWYKKTIEPLYEAEIAKL